MKKTILVLTVVLSLCATLLLVGCGSAQSNESSGDSIEYADQAYLDSMVTGLQKRWDLTDAFDKEHPDNTEVMATKEGKEAYESFVKAELDELEKYRNMPFEDSTLQERALTYINSLDGQLATMENWYDYEKWSIDWDAAYNQRTSALLQILENYDLNFDEKYQETVDQLTTAGKKAQATNEINESIDLLIDSIEFELSDGSSSWKEYKAVVENTTSANFKSFSVDVNLFDDDGVNLNTESCYIENWGPGEKAKFSFSTDEEFSSYKVTLNYWEDDQGNYSY